MSWTSSFISMRCVATDGHNEDRLNSFLHAHDSWAQSLRGTRHREPESSMLTLRSHPHVCGCAHVCCANSSLVNAQVHCIIDEIIANGDMVETNKTNALEPIRVLRRSVAAANGSGASAD